VFKFCADQIATGTIKGDHSKNKSGDTLRLAYWAPLKYTVTVQFMFC